MSATKIEWCDKTWSPITGCTPISEGCENCYAKRMAKRLAGRCGYPSQDPFSITMHPEKLDEPDHWIKPKRIFICSMSDLFHSEVSILFIRMVLNTVKRNPHHTFMILTKRPERMEEILNHNSMFVEDPNRSDGWRFNAPPNLWIGVTAENQARADERIPILLQIPSAVRFVSLEPMLGPVDLRKWLPGCWECSGSCGYRQTDQPEEQRCYECGYDQDLSGEWGQDQYGQDKCPECGAIGSIIYPCPRCNDYEMVQGHPDTPCLSWVILGGETGPGARPMHPDWVRSVRDQCVSAGVPFFLKQWGEWKKSDVPCIPGTHTGGGIYLTHEGRMVGQGEWWEGRAEAMDRVGKKSAGRLLDGRTWEQYPEVQRRAARDRGEG
jgi:protein gp37